MCVALIAYSYFSLLLPVYVECVIYRMHISFFLQILEVNGQNFENVQLSKANEILKNNTHLSITVKTNLLGQFLTQYLSVYLPPN